MVGKKRSDSQPTPRRRFTERAGAANQPKAGYTYYRSGVQAQQPLDGRQRLRPQETVAMQPQRRPQAKGAFGRRLLWGLLGLALAGGFVWNLSVASTPQVTIVSDEKNASLAQPTEVYEAAIENSLHSFGDRLKWNISSSALEQALLAKFPELQNAEIVVPTIGRQVAVTLRVATPAFVIISNDGRSFVVDETGRAVSTDVGNATSTLPRITDQTGLSSELGHAVFADTEIKFIRELNRQFSAKDMRITGLVLPAEASRVHVMIEGLPYYIMFSLQSDAAQQVGAFLATYDRLQQEGRTPSQYVDVRLGDRVFTK